MRPHCAFSETYGIQFWRVYSNLTFVRSPPPQAYTLIAIVPWRIGSIKKQTTIGAFNQLGSWWVVLQTVALFPHLCPILTTSNRQLSHPFQQHLLVVEKSFGVVSAKLTLTALTLNARVLSAYVLDLCGFFLSGLVFCEELFCSLRCVTSYSECALELVLSAHGKLESEGFGGWLRRLAFAMMMSLWIKDQSTLRFKPQVWQIAGWDSVDFRQGCLTAVLEDPGLPRFMEIFFTAGWFIPEALTTMVEFSYPT